MPICKTCNGKGYYEVESSYGTEQVKCHCQQEQTNEKWLRTLPTTEELAKAIMECVVAKSWMFNEQSILRWLKEKHE